MRTCICLLTFLICSLESRASEAFSNHNNIFCILNKGCLNFVDWSDIAHPQKLSCLKLKPIDGIKEDEFYCSDVAFNGNTAYVSVEDKGIMIIDTSDPKKPVQKEFIPINYSDCLNDHEYSEQSIKLNSEAISIISEYTDKRSRKQTRLQILDLSEKELLEDTRIDDFDNPGGYPFFNYTRNVLYYRPRIIGNKFIFLSSGLKTGEKSITTTTMGLANTGFSPAMQINNQNAAITLGKYLWLMDLKNMKFVFEKKFDFPIYVCALSEKYTMIDSKDRYYFVDNKNFDHIIPWDHEKGLNAKDDVECMMVGDLLLSKCVDYRGDQEFFYGYNVSNPNSIHKVTLPFPIYLEKIVWIIQSNNIIFAILSNSPGHTLKIIDCRETEHPKLRGTIKNVSCSPKGFIVNGDRIYIINAESKVPEESWKTYRGLPTAIDISDLDKPEIKSIFNPN